jgi:hypothetical protein
MDGPVEQLPALIFVVRQRRGARGETEGDY